VTTERGDPAYGKLCGRVGVVRGLALDSFYLGEYVSADHAHLPPGVGWLDLRRSRIESLEKTRIDQSRMVRGEAAAAEPDEAGSLLAAGILRACGSARSVRQRFRRGSRRVGEELRALCGHRKQKA
jgi:hypothetical protein